MASPSPDPVPPPPRVLSVDVYRGFVMALMLAEVFHLSGVAKDFARSDWQPGPWFQRTGLAPAAEAVRNLPVWSFLAWHQTHVEWRGCTLHDLIQPSFSFLVGVAVPLSLASRAARGQSLTRRILHALWRSVLLIALGNLLRSNVRDGTWWQFSETLTQIGLGYTVLVILGHLKPVWHYIALGIILAGYWAAFALYPLPPEGFDPATVGVKAEWRKEHELTGFMAHWNKNTNPASDFDAWFLNGKWFPRPRPVNYNSGGYATLSFIPTLGTMILGLISGTWLRWDENVWRKIGRFAAVGVGLIAAGYGLELLGVCPVVKRIWTPAWVLFSGGWCFLLLAAFHAALDTGGPTGWAFPLKVIGMNSIAAYVMASWFRNFLNDRFDIHFGKNYFHDQFGAGYEHLVHGAALFACYWLVLFWMYRRKLFLKI